GIRDRNVTGVQTCALPISNSFTLVAIPLFVLAGEIMARGGISERLVNFSKIIVGPIPGGLAVVVIISSVFFAALTGTALAAAAEIGRASCRERAEERVGGV